MSEKTVRILYVHGYLGHAGGSSCRLIAEALSKAGINYTLDSPEFPVTEPGKMHDILWDAANDYDYIAASSMGAFYAMQITGPKLILVNPAFPGDLRRLREKAPINNPLLTDALLERLTAVKDHFFRYIHNEESVRRSYFIFGTYDDIAHSESAVREYYGDASHIFHVDMEHKLDSTGARLIAEIIAGEADRNV